MTRTSLAAIQKRIDHIETVEDENKALKARLAKARRLAGQLRSAVTDGLAALDSLLADVGPAPVKRKAKTWKAPAAVPVAGEAVPEAVGA